MLGTLVPKFMKIQAKIAFAAVFAASACETPQPVSAPAPVGPAKTVPTHHTLRLGSPMPSAPPLPTQYPVTVTQYFSDGQSVERVSFRGWDMNQDGRLDMVEVLGLDGNVLDRVFDFNFDGKIDYRRTIETVDAASPPPPSPPAPGLRGIAPDAAPARSARM